MGFDREGVSTEGRAVSSVCHGVEYGRVGCVTDLHACDVDPVGGEQLVVRREVDGRYGLFGTDAAATGGSGKDGKWAAQKGARRGHISDSYTLAYLAARDGQAA